MGARFVSVDRDTPMLLPPDLRDWVPDDDLVHFVIEAVDGSLYRFWDRWIDRRFLVGRHGRTAVSGCAHPRSLQPSCHPGTEGPHKILPTAQPMLEIEPDLLTLSGPKTGSRPTELITPAKPPV